MVISSALAAMILVAGYMCLNACMASQKMIEPRAEVAQNARAALAIMTADLRVACPLSKDFDFLGMDRMLEDVEADNLDFATHNYFPQRLGEGDFCEVSYFLEKDEHGKFNLWRRRNPTISLDPLSGGRREEIARELLGVRFEYFDGFDWYDDWGQLEPSEEEIDPLLEPNLSGMPEAVRITLLFDPNPGKRATSRETTAAPALVFQTVVRLESVNGSIPEGGTGGASANASPLTLIAGVNLNCVRHTCPKGTIDNSRAFQRRVNCEQLQVPEGRLKFVDERPLPFFRAAVSHPFGTCFSIMSPALKRRASFSQSLRDKTISERHLHLRAYPHSNYA